MKDLIRSISIAIAASQLKTDNVIRIQELTGPKIDAVKIHMPALKPASNQPFYMTVPKRRKRK